MKLNLGCGPNIFPGWINIDKVDMEEAYLRHLREPFDESTWPANQQALVHYIRGGGLIDFRVADIRKPLAFETDSIESVYLGQMIEHMQPITEAPAFLRECHRVLKPGGKIRITTPDLNQLISAYQRKALDSFASEQPECYRGASRGDQLSYLLFGALGPNCTTENYEGHFHCYTPWALRERLREAGFHDAHMMGDLPPVKSPEFADCHDAGMTHSLAMEAQK